MILETFCCGPCQTNSYLVACPITHKAFVVDASQGSAPLIQRALQKHKLTLEKIFLTHSHWDHIADAKELFSSTQAPLLIHRLDAPNLILPGKDGLPLYFSIEGMEPTGFLEEGDILTVGELTIQVLHTPGHSPGGVCLYLPKEESLFSGDTLFQGTMGRIDFPTSKPEDMWKSLQKLAKLPSHTKVFPGHGDPTSIRNEPWMTHAHKKFT
ncbi:MAG: MBL fold metallo-hydrolase [Chlamydiota bacterium]